MGFAQVSGTLWRQRELLELLLFKLEEEQLLLSAGRTRWLAYATREVEEVLEQIRQAELLRAVEVDGYAAELSLPPGASLREIADAAPEPHRELLHAHRRAFVELTAEVAAVAANNRELLARSHQATQETLATLTESIGTYDHVGASTASPSAARLVDEAL